ncbi:hypothetical protein [Nocardioides sp.]|uniref:hypothetical protein n=1 Tax=Nocardioides sp. TaxID=35761 RepID=UPI002C258360|nr:hypothetical protein [Nocardioides sp.]HXH79572.1 hypothetical protein [Nocardioides sp.]
MWQPLRESSVEGVHRVLAEVDVAFGDVVERSVADVGEVLAAGSFWGVHNPEGRLVAVAGSVHDEECVLRVAAAHPGRAELLAEAVPLLEEALAAGAPLWLPTQDRDAGAVAAAHGLASAYTDLQMRTRTAVASAGPPPAGMRPARAGPLGPPRRPRPGVCRLGRGGPLARVPPPVRAGSARARDVGPARERGT